MESIYNLLVFPCGSEIGLEIHRSLKYSRHINLIGASSVDDHGKFVYSTYVGGLPFISDDGFIKKINEVVKEYKIDAIFPTMDYVINFLKTNENKLNCKVIASSAATTSICSSKALTYKCLKGALNIPQIFNSIDDVDNYPVFMKPDIGYGSRGAKKVNNREEAVTHLNSFPDCLILQYLPGNEFTVDCFTNSKGELLFSRARKRARIVNGISVNTYFISDGNEKFSAIADLINTKIKFIGSWFFQVKEDANGELFLLEIACRLGGSSSLSRILGVNFALLNVYAAFDLPLTIFLNDFEVELDRALDNKFKTNINYDKVYIDFDDCLLLNGKVNIQLISFIYHLINQNIERILITKHEYDIAESLKKLKIGSVFSKIIHIKKNDKKIDYIDPRNAIFIDDSFAERKEVYEKYNIPVFAPDAVESLF